MERKNWSIPHWLHIPSLCALCQCYHQKKGAICGSCFELFSPLGFSCQICKAPLPSDTFPMCGQCIKQKPHFDQVAVNYQFKEPLRSLLHQFKYHQFLHFNSLLVDLMMQSPPESIQQTDCLIPVPLHPKRLKNRGYNQAAELTKCIANQVKKPYALFLAQKIKNTSPQAGKSGQERRQSLQGCFEAKPHRFKHITIIDDLLTTGSTANELAKALKNAGAEKVIVWCCARA